MYSAHKFVIPACVPVSSQVDYCLDIIGKYRNELQPIRGQLVLALKKEDYLNKQIKHWKDKYHKTKQIESKLQEEINRLKKEIEKLTTTNHRYQVSLFDHGNFANPEKSGKLKGGQPNHPDTNRENTEDYQVHEHKRIAFTHCPHCNHALKSVRSIKSKVLIDIVLNPQVVKLILDSERQWCSHCRKTVIARDDRSLPFSEYGINTLMVILLLRFRCLLSLRNIGTVIGIVGGLTLSKSEIANLLNQSKLYLQDRYADLVKAVRRGEIMYTDETGWQVRGKVAWLWIMANEDVAVYQAAESRGHGVAKTMYGDSNSSSMHDGYSGYAWLPHTKTFYCWAHLLRFAYEETSEIKNRSPGIRFRDTLVNTYRLIDQRNKYTEQDFKSLVRLHLESLMAIKSKLIPVNRIQHRLKGQKEGLINALVYSPNGTNNLAERELRPMVIMRKTSFGSDTLKGMETSAILGSVIQTMHRQNIPFLPTLKEYLHVGIQQSSNYLFANS